VRSRFWVSQPFSAFGTRMCLGVLLSSGSCQYTSPPASCWCWWVCREGGMEKQWMDLRGACNSQAFGSMLVAGVANTCRPGCLQFYVFLPVSIIVDIIRISGSAPAARGRSVGGMCCHPSASVAVKCLPGQLPAQQLAESSHQHICGRMTAVPATRYQHIVSRVLELP
jgi:hypothetical protein